MGIFTHPLPDSMMRFILLLLLLSLSSIAAADYAPLQHTEIGIFSSLPNQPTLIQPIFSPDNGMHTLVRLITSATSTIDVQNQYFYKFNRNNDWLLSSSATDTRSPNPRPIDIHPLIAALYLASKRGVRVRVSLPACHAGYATSASGCRSPDTYNAVAFFQSVGIQVRLLNNTDLYIHNKGWVIDQQIVVISSINFSKTSLTDNREAGVVITDTRLAAWYGAEFQYDWEQSVEVTPTSPPASVRDPNITLIMSYYPEIPHPPVRVYATFYTFTTNGANQIMSFNLLKQQTAATKKVFHAQMYEMTSNTVIQPILDMIDAGYPNGLDASIIVTSSTVEGSDDLTRVNLLVNNQLPNGTPAPAHVWYSSNNFTYQHAKFWLMDGINTTIYSGNWAGTSFPTNNNNGRNREWGISITSICINSIFESIWQQDRKRASAFVPPQANAGLTTPNDCTIDSCGICSRSGITSTCYDIATVCVDGASATGPFDGTTSAPSTNPGTPGTTGTNTGSNTGTTTGSSTGTKSNAATSPSATSLLVFLLPFMILFA